MPATQTQTEPKTKKSTNTKTKPKTKVEPDAQTEVNPKLQRAVNEYVKADAGMQTKLWPLVERALDLIDEPMTCEDVLGQFRMAFALAHRIKVGEYEKNLEYGRFRHASLDVVRVASLGRANVEENHKRGVTFHRLLDAANGKHASEGDFTFFEPKPSKADKAKPTEAKAKPEAETKAEAEEEHGSAETEKATPEWRARFKYIVKHETPAFIEVVEECIAKGTLPDKCPGCQAEFIDIVRKYIEGNE